MEIPGVFCNINGQSSLTISLTHLSQIIIAWKFYSVVCEKSRHAGAGGEKQQAINEFPSL